MHACLKPPMHKANIKPGGKQVPDGLEHDLHGLIRVQVVPANIPRIWWREHPELLRVGLALQLQGHLGILPARESDEGTRRVDAEIRRLAHGSFPNSPLLLDDLHQQVPQAIIKEVEAIDRHILDVSVSEQPPKH